MNIDFSWIDKEEKLLKLEDDPSIKVPIENIRIKAIFIGNEKENEFCIKHVIKFNYTLIECETSIDNRYFSVPDIRNKILEKCPNYNKYNLVDISIFHVNIPYDKISTDFIEDIKTIKTLWKEGGEDIRFKIPPALFIFNDIHTLYCILKEPAASPSPSNTPASILKQISSFDGENIRRTHTKRVRVNLLNNTYSTPENTYQLINPRKRFTRHKK